ncbi:AzlD domain-containing protein [Kribbella sp. NPDC055071]
MKLWLSILVVSIGNWLLKAGGPLVIGRRELPAWLVRVTELTAPALLAGLIVTDLGGRTVDWTQLVGVGTAAGLNLLRVPLLPAACAGIVATAVLRAML